MCWVLAVMGVVGVVVGGRMSVPSMVAYNPHSLAVAKISLFQVTQLSLPNLGLRSRNLCISCLGCVVDVAI